MSFCTNCGSKLPDNAKFCTRCGASVPKNRQAAVSSREDVYDGLIYKCPHCGEILQSFTARCPSCGCELRGNMAARSIHEFYQDLIREKSQAQQDNIIRNFPIPNTKEDILEFMILASANILENSNSTVCESWMVKFDQAYQKALILFQNDSDFAKFQEIYDNCQANVHIKKRHKIGKFTIRMIIRNIIVCSGLLLMITAIITDHTGGNASLMELIAYIILIASAASLSRPGALPADYAIGAAGGLLIFLLSLLLKNGSMGELCGGIVLILVALNYCKYVKTEPRS